MKNIKYILAAGYYMASSLALLFFIAVLQLFTPLFFLRLPSMHSLEIWCALAAVFFVTGLVFAYVHECIPRCGSSLYAKSWRFYALMSFQALPFFLISFLLGVDIYALLHAAGVLLLASLAGVPMLVWALYTFPAPSVGCSIK